MISGDAIKAGTLTKGVLAKRIAEILDIGGAKGSRGSTVQRETIEAIYHALTGESEHVGKYRGAEAALAALDLVYDPAWDSSESHGPTGGSTVTTRCYSRILAALTSTPRCFILNVSDGDQGLTWETDHRIVYRFDSSVSGRKALLDAGPNSRVIFYSTGKSKQHQMTFSGCALVTHVSGRRNSNQNELSFDEFFDFPEPVPSTSVSIGGWNRQNSITEIPFDLWRQMCLAGGYDQLSDPHGEAEAIDKAASASLADQLPQPTAPPNFSLRDHSNFEPRPLERLTSPTYSEDSNRRLQPNNHLLEGRGQNQATNQAIERRAVEVVRVALAADGWRETADRQRDGCGYDLEFIRDARVVHVEVKGIRGPQLVFNITPKERWRIETDRNFVLLAVTRALSENWELHQLGPEDLSSLEFQATGYRLDGRPLTKADK